MGPLAVVASGEYHEDAFGIRAISRDVLGSTTTNGTNHAAKDFAWRLAAGYDIPIGASTLNVVGMIDQLRYKQDDPVAGYSKYSRFAWMAGLKFRTGDHELRARYSQALKPSITAAGPTNGNEDDLKAQNIALGYAYFLAKSTQVYAFWSKVFNESRARYTFAVGGSANVVGANTPIGSDPNAVGLGIRYAF
jgi:predicted porin